MVQQRCNRDIEYNRIQKSLAYALVIYEHRGGFAVFDTRVLEGDIHIAGHRHKSRFSEALVDHEWSNVQATSSALDMSFYTSLMTS